MAWTCSAPTGAEMIKKLCDARLITSERVRTAMLAVDRKHYVPSQLHHAAYCDSPQPLCPGATISAPHMHAMACEILLPFLPENRGARVLDVGSGSGYLTHVFATLLCGSYGTGDGTVVGIEHNDMLTKMAIESAQKAGAKSMLDNGKMKFVTGDGRRGYAEPQENEPLESKLYDAIHVGAAASSIYPELVKQLKNPGRMFIPVNEPFNPMSQWIWVVEKDANGSVTKKKHTAVSFVPLTDAPDLL